MTQAPLAAVAMSGGIDSSVAALLLKRQGYRVIGLTMELVRQQGAARSGRVGACCSLSDLRDARLVAGALDIPHYVVRMEDEFRSQVIEPFLKDYREGKTPSPCVLCNSRMKFNRLKLLARKSGAQYLATGHYARLEKTTQCGSVKLLKGVDPAKDQSYFLFELGQEELTNVVFPLGEMRKEQVRQIAQEAGLPVARKQESQELCFVQEDTYAQLLEQGNVPRPEPGPIVDLDGNLVGEHQGIHRHTVGQRRGLGIAHHEPLYVVEIRAKTNQIVVGPRKALLKPTLVADGLRWVKGAPPSPGSGVHAKIRSRHDPAPARVYPGEPEPGQVRVCFDEPQSAITPGQAVVLYHEDQVLGGGWILYAE